MSLIIRGPNYLFPAGASCVDTDDMWLSGSDEVQHESKCTPDKVSTGVFSEPRSK